MEKKKISKVHRKESDKKDNKDKKDKKDNKDKKDKKDKIEKIWFEGNHSCSSYPCNDIIFSIYEKEKNAICPKSSLSYLKPYINEFTNTIFVEQDESNGDELEDDYSHDFESEGDDQENDKENNQGDEEDNEEGEDQKEERDIAYITKEFPNLLFHIAFEYITANFDGVDECDFLTKDEFKKRINGRIAITDEYLEQNKSKINPNLIELTKKLKEIFLSKSDKDLNSLFGVFKKLESSENKNQKDEKEKDDVFAKKKYQKGDEEEDDDDEDEDEDDDEDEFYYFSLEIFNSEKCLKKDLKEKVSWSPYYWNEELSLDYRTDLLNREKYLTHENEIILKLSFPFIKPKTFQLKSNDINGFIFSDLLSQIASIILKEHENVDYELDEEIHDLSDEIEPRYKLLYQKALKLWKKYLKNEYGIKKNFPSAILLSEFNEDESSSEEEQIDEKSSKNKKNKKSSNDEEEKSKKKGKDEKESEEEDVIDLSDIEFFQSSLKDPTFLICEIESLEYSSLEFNPKTKVITPILDIDGIMFDDAENYQELLELISDISTSLSTIRRDGEKI
jgi:hypothetical protein